MLKKTITTALICSASLLATACRTEDAHAVLVGRFTDEDPMVTSIIIPQPERGEYAMYFALRQAETLCVLAGAIREDDIPFFERCDGLSGIGSISCNNGRSSEVTWKLTSCHGGHGHSVGNLGPNFSFGFDRDKEKAMELLRGAEHAH